MKKKTAKNKKTENCLNKQTVFAGKVGRQWRVSKH